MPVKSRHSSRPAPSAAKRQRQPKSRLPRKAPAAAARTAIIDIGSNTVRLVIFEGAALLGSPIFNEKVHCELARGLTETGRLHPEGRVRAIAALVRFVRLARAMGARKIEAVATAAVRTAKDGEAFVALAKRRFKIPVQTLSGTQEAEISAHGFLAHVPEADGVFADLGGGSLELVELNRGKIGQCKSLLLGHLLLAERSSRNRKRAANLVEKELSTVSWLRRLKGRNLYVTGGAWRTIARVVLDQTNHPLHIIDGYELDSEKILPLLGLLSGLSQDTLLKIGAIVPRRAETLPYAALVLRQLIEFGLPDTVVFSGFGVREGIFLSTLPDFPAVKPNLLVEGAAAIGQRLGRKELGGEEICHWLNPLALHLHKKQDARERKLRLVIGHLFDIARFDHPDFRAEHAFTRVLNLPIGGLSHADRAYVALAIFIRYNGKIDSSLTKPAFKLLDAGRMYSSNILGLALQLAQAISGGTPGLLRHTTLKVARGALVFKLPRSYAPYMGETVEHRLKILARALDLKPRVR